MTRGLQKLVMLGGSNAFGEISEIIEDINRIEPTYEIIEILDDNQDLWGKKYSGIEVTGALNRVHGFPNEVRFVFGIGSHRTRILRAGILERLNLPQDRFATIIHPTAKIFSTARVNPGCIIHYGTVIYGHTLVDSFSIIAANCVIAVRNIIGKGALLGSNITTTFGTKIGCYSFIGSSSSIAENIEIEPGAQVGMGSLVLRNVAHGAFVLGNPPRVLDKIEVPESILTEWAEIKSHF